MALLEKGYQKRIAEKVLTVTVIGGIVYLLLRYTPLHMKDAVAGVIGATF